MTNLIQQCAIFMQLSCHYKIFHYTFLNLYRTTRISECCGYSRYKNLTTANIFFDKFRGFINMKFEDTHNNLMNKRYHAFGDTRNSRTPKISRQYPRLLWVSSNFLEPQRYQCWWGSLFKVRGCTLPVLFFKITGMGNQANTFQHNTGKSDPGQLRQTVRLRQSHLPAESMPNPALMPSQNSRTYSVDKTSLKDNSGNCKNAFLKDFICCVTDT